MSQSYDEDAGYGSEDASYEEVGTKVPQQIDEPIIKELKHVSGDELFGIQYKTFVFESEYASPSELARKPALCKASLQSSTFKHLHQVTSINNRANPAAEHLEGNTDRMVIVSLVVTGTVNGFDYPIDADFNKNVPTYIGTATGNRAGIVMEPGTHMGLNIDVHAPEDLMVADFLRIWETCDPSALEREFTYIQEPGGEKQCLIFLDGAANMVLKKNPAKYEGFRLGAPMPGTRSAHAPNHIAERLYNNMKNSLATIEKSFVSAKDIGVDFRPHFGKWDDVTSIAGDISTLSTDKAIEHSNRVLTTKRRKAIHARIGFLSVAQVYPEKK